MQVFHADDALNLGKLVVDFVPIDLIILFQLINISTLTECIIIMVIIYNLLYMSWDSFHEYCEYSVKKRYGGIEH